MGKLKNIRASVRRLKKDKRIRFSVTLSAVVLSAFIQAWALQVFVRPAGIISGGFTGIAMLIERLGDLNHISIPMQIPLLMLNIPVALMCCRGISIRFTAFSLLQVALSSMFLQICSFEILFQDIVLNVIFGGVVLGASIVIALKGNASSGGTDFIALYVSNKTGRSIWSYVFMGNAVMYCLYGLIFGWEYAGYSIIFQFISTRMISAFHHRYELVTLQITTKKGPQVAEAYISHFRHGISCVEAVGGYSGKKMYILNTVLSSYEVSDALRVMQEADDHIIINVLKTQQFIGSFYRAPME
ncbi:MAG: YitT family protein [Enterocloster sp.]